MEIDEAIKRAVKKFYDGHEYSKLEQTTGKKMKYSKAALDEIEDYVKSLAAKSDKKEGKV
jgi:hypothetical protein